MKWILYRWVERVYRIESLVAVKQRRDTVIRICPVLGDHIDHCPRRLSEFGFESGRQHLKLGDGLLIKLGRGSAIDGIFVRLSVNEEIVIATSFAQNRIRIVSSRLPIDRDSGHALHQVEV